jgi:hypothetical protein
VIALAPAYSAAAKECTDAHMKQMDGVIAKMTDAAKKKEATTALDMSKADMKKRQYGRLHEIHEGGAHRYGPPVGGRSTKRSKGGIACEIYSSVIPQFDCYFWLAL